jgi:hypothetical protein
MKLLSPEKPTQDCGNLVKQAYFKETCLKEDFMDVKDFFYNITKSLCIHTVFDTKTLRA